MGKGKRTRLQNAGKKEELLRRQQEEQQRRVRRRKIGIGVGAAAVILCGSLIGKAVYDHQRLYSGDDLRATIMAESENYQVTGTMMSVYVNSMYQNYVSQYGDYLYLLGLDTGTSLKEQAYSDDQTWFEYLTQAAENNAQQYLILAESAADAGVSLTEGEIANLDASLEKIDPSSYGIGVNREDLREAMMLQSLAEKYQNILDNGYTYSEDEIQKYYEENLYDFLSCDTYSYTFVYETDPEEESEDGETGMTREQAQKLASEPASCEEEEAFCQWLRAYFEANHEPEEDETEEDLASQVETQVEACRQTLTYTEGDDIAEWAYADGAKAGQTYVLEDAEKQTFTVTLLASLPARDESVTVDIRHILLTTDRYGSEEAAKEKAEELLQEWKDGDATEDSFAELAGSWSADSGSSLNGGLYRYVVEGQTVEAFNDWCFDSTRKAGDTGIVQTDYGFHVMYYTGTETPGWKAQAESSLTEQSYEADYEAMSSAHTVTVYADRYDQIPSITG